MTGHILVVGSLNMDLVVVAPHLPQPGETILGSRFQTFPGGKGANQAVAAARLGGEVKMIGRVGADSFGAQLLQTVHSEGIDTTGIIQDPADSSGVALITVDHSGQNTIVVASGTNSRLTPQDVTGFEKAFAGAAVVLIQLEIPLVTVVRAIQLARRHGVRVVLNPAPAQLLSNELLAEVDYIIPNQNELALLTSLNDIPAASAALQRSGVRWVIITLGKDGALVVEESGETHLPAYPVKAVDATAAGDAFVGAFAVALTEGYSPLQAAAWGNAAGALAVTRPGAQPSLPTRAELEQLLSKNLPEH